MKILVPVDGSAFTQRMLDYLAAHADWLGPQHEYTLLNVVPALPGRAASHFTENTLKEYYDDEAEKVFAPIRAFFDKQGLKAQFVARVGSAADTIASVASKSGSDLLVLGSHGHGSLVNLVMGSVATKVLAHCSTPVLLIR